MHLTLLPALLTSLLLGAAPRAIAEPSTAGASTAGKVPTLLSAVPAEEGLHAQVTAGQHNAGVTILQLRGMPGTALAGQQLSPLRVNHWPTGVQAGRLTGTVLRVNAERRPDGSSTALTLTRAAKDRPLYTLLSGIRPAEPLGLGLTLETVTASSVTIQSAGQAGEQRTLRPGQRATLPSAQGSVCLQLHAVTPVRTDFAEQGRPPAITGYRLTISLLTPDPATDCA